MTPDSKFWDKVYRENAPKLISVCRRYVRNDVVAEDLVQESFLVAISKIDSYSGSGSIEAWLRKIAVNISLMYLRKGKTKIDTYDLEPDCLEESIDYDIENVAEPDKWINLENNFFFSAIDGLPIHHRTVFNLYVLDNYSHKEIADELNISIGTSKSHLARARKKLQMVVKKKLSEDRSLKSLGSGILLIFVNAFVKAMGIDLLFKLKLKYFSIKAQKYPNFSDLNIDSQVITTPDLFSVFSVKRNLLQIKSLAATIVLLVVTTQMININNFSQVKFAVPSNNFQTQALDTMQSSKKKLTKNPVKLKEQIVKPSESITDSHKSQEIIVKKQIVKKQTIKVHNTVVVYDTIKVN